MRTWLLALLGIAILAGCGGASVAPAAVPAVPPPPRPGWVDAGGAAVTDRFPAAEFAVGTGSAGGPADDDAVRRAAENNALDEINRQVRVTVNSAIRQVDSAIERYAGGAVETAQTAAFLAETVSASAGTLAGAAFERWYDPEGHRLHVLAAVSRRANRALVLDRGTAAAAAGDQAAAAGWFTVARAIDPSDMDAYERLAGALEASGRLAEAAAVYEDIRAAVPAGAVHERAGERLALVKRRTGEALAARAAVSADLAEGTRLFKEALFSAPDEAGRVKVAAGFQAFLLARGADLFVDGAKRSGLGRIGVFEIKDEFGQTAPAGSAAADKFTAELVRAAAGAVEVVERARITDIINEFDVSDPLSLDEIARRFGVQGMIVGTVGRRLNLRLLNKETGGIVAAVSEDWFGGERGLQAVFAGAGAQAPEQIKLEIAVFGQRRVGRDWMNVEVNDGSVLASGDLFKVNFAADRDAYVYLFFYDSQGEASILFPVSEIFYASKVKAGTTITLPAVEDEWFWLDENTGRETLYFIASVEPLADIEKLLGRMKDAGGAQAMAAVVNGMGTRGLKGITKGKTVAVKGKDGRTVEKVTDLIKGLGTAVQVITINHQ
ncbi:MAG: DUF4384 domain-containing protein [Planctomycetota bacterium]